MTREKAVGWLWNLARFPLADLVILCGVIVFLVSPHPDVEARANLVTHSEKLKELEINKADKSVASAEREVVLQKIQSVMDIQKRIDEETQKRLTRIENKIDQKIK